MASSPGAPHIPGYRDLVPIGRGGFSEVFRAWQESFDRWVALKVLTFAVLDDRARERFRRECRTTGRFSGHPNVVVVHDADVTPDGRPYLAMQLYEGGSTLDRLREDPPLLVDDVLTWTIQVAGALETAHRAGILHRDVKPGNILLTSYGLPVLTDFGLSILSEQQEISFGMDALTPNHAAPEVLERGEASPSTDLYALGSTAYTLLVGHAPHQSRAGEGVAARLLRVLQEPVPPIERPDVPVSLRTIVESALAREPADRPRSAAAMADTLMQVRRELGLPEVRPTVLDHVLAAPVSAESGPAVFAAPPSTVENPAPAAAAPAARATSGPSTWAPAPPAPTAPAPPAPPPPPSGPPLVAAGPAGAVPPPPGEPGSGAGRMGPTGAGILDDPAAAPVLPDGSETVSRAALDAPAEEAPPPPSPVPTPIIVLGVLLALGLIGLVVAILLSRGDDDEPDDTTTTTVFEPEEVPSGPQVALNPAGIRVTWDGRDDANYVVLILSEDAPPRNLPAEGPALLLPVDEYDPEGAYCIAVAYTDELQNAPAGQASAAFSPPECVNDATQESVQQR